MMSRSPLAAVLCLALIGVGVPTRSAASMAALAATEVPESVYVEIGEDLFHVDFTSVIANRSNVAGGSGSFTISVKKARLVDDDAGAAFVLGDAPSMRDVRLLGSDPKRAASVTGIDLEAVRVWREVIAWTVTKSPSLTTTSFEVGLDRLSLSVPQSVIDGNPLAGDTVDVTLNSFVVPLPPERYYRSVTDLLRGVPPADEDDLLLHLVGQFVDSGAFLNSYVGFELIAEKIFSTHAGGDGCVGPCMTCVASGLMSVASFFAVVGSCAAAVGSGGLIGPVCAAALLAHIGTNLTTISFCGICVDCLNPDPPGGGGGGGGGDGPSGECPAGYHECCNNQCCSNDNPPASCNEV